MDTLVFLPSLVFLLSAAMFTVALRARRLDDQRREAASLGAVRRLMAGGVMAGGVLVSLRQTRGQPLVAEST